MVISTPGSRIESGNRGGYKSQISEKATLQGAAACASGGVTNENNFVYNIFMFCLRNKSGILFKKFGMVIQCDSV